jgi:hypothetical protein
MSDADEAEAPESLVQRLAVRLLRNRIRESAGRPRCCSTRAGACDARPRAASAAAPAVAVASPSATRRLAPGAVFARSDGPPRRFGRCSCARCLTWARSRRWRRSSTRRRASACTQAARGACRRRRCALCSIALWRGRTTPRAPAPCSRRCPQSRTTWSAFASWLPPSAKRCAAQRFICAFFF